MAYLRCDFHAEKIGVQTSMIVILPDAGALSEAPVIWLLHGLTDNCTGWTRYTSIERYARKYGTAVVMPEVQRSFYTDMVLGQQYFQFVLEELPGFCRRVFGFSAAREKNYIMGLSMGGYGALKCALTAPENYAGCAAFSSVADITARVRKAQLQKQAEFQAIFGYDMKIPPEADLFVLTERSDPKKLPAIYMTCGEQDDLYSGNARLAKALAEKGADLTFEHWEGVHSWDFWDRSAALAMERFLG